MCQNFKRLNVQKDEQIEALWDEPQTYLGTQSNISRLSQRFWQISKYYWKSEEKCVLNQDSCENASKGGVMRPYNKKLSKTAPCQTNRKKKIRKTVIS